MRECSRWECWPQFYFELYPVLRYLFCSYFWKSLHHLHWHIFIESLSIHTWGIPYFFLEGPELLGFFSLRFHQVSILILQLLVLGQQLSIFLTEILDLSLMNFHGIFEEIHLLFHDTIEKRDIFIALTICREEWALFEGSTRWRWGCSDVHPCPGGLMCREKSTVVIFCEIVHFIFVVQQGQLGNPQNMLLLGCLFGECLYLTLFFTLIND